MNAPEILVTGGTGTLGRRVVDRLRAAGREVRVLSRSGRPGTVRWEEFLRERTRHQRISGPAGEGM